MKNEITFFLLGIPVILCEVCVSVHRDENAVWPYCNKKNYVILAAADVTLWELIV